MADPQRSTGENLENSRSRDARKQVRKKQNEAGEDVSGLGSCGGGKRDRTADLLTASQALYQLSYTPQQAHETACQVFPYCRKIRGAMSSSHAILLARFARKRSGSFHFKPIRTMDPERRRRPTGSPVAQPTAFGKFSTGTKSGHKHTRLGNEIWILRQGLCPPLSRLCGFEGRSRQER